MRLQRQQVISSDTSDSADDEPMATLLEKLNAGEKMQQVIALGNMKNYFQNFEGKKLNQLEKRLL